MMGRFGKLWMMVVFASTAVWGSDVGEKEPLATPTPRSEVVEALLQQMGEALDYLPAQFHKPVDAVAQASQRPVSEEGSLDYVGADYMNAEAKPASPSCAQCGDAKPVVIRGDRCWSPRHTEVLCSQCDKPRTLYVYHGSSSDSDEGEPCEPLPESQPAESAP